MNLSSVAAVPVYFTIGNPRIGIILPLSLQKNEDGSRISPALFVKSFPNTQSLIKLYKYE